MSDAVEWVDAFAADDIPDGYSTGVEVNGHPVALFNHGGSFFAVRNRCPHAGASLAGSPINEKGFFRCMLHGWPFKLGGCEDDDGLQRFPVKVEDGRLLVGSTPLPVDQAA
jgi:nitrite reductase/ring-hydroxylating ferredoxin subunit